MILTCPNCSTRYLTKAEAIGENGRTVRCSKCAHSWFVAAEHDALTLEDQATPEMEMLHEDSSGKDGAAEGSHERRRAEDRRAQGAHVAFRDKADRKRRKSRIFGVAMIWGTTLGMLGLATFAAFLFRQPIINNYPQTTEIYKAFGVEASVTGLVLDAPQTEYILIEGEQRLVVNGMVQNLTKHDKDIPLVRLSILNNNDEEITHWFFQPSPNKVGPRGTVEFATEYPNPPVEASSLIYELSTDKG